MNENKAMIESLIHFVKGRVEPIRDDWSIKTILKNQSQIRFSENQIDISKNWNEIKFELFLSRKRSEGDRC